MTTPPRPRQLRDQESARNRALAAPARPNPVPVRLPPEDHAWLQARIARTGESANAVMCAALAAYRRQAEQRAGQARAREIRRNR